MVLCGRKLQTSNHNVSLQFGNNATTQPVRAFGFTRILLQFIPGDISDSVNCKDKYSLNCKDILSLSNSVKLTSNDWSLNSCTKTISYKAIYVSSIDTQASNCQSISLFWIC